MSWIISSSCLYVCAISYNMALYHYHVCWAFLNHKNHGCILIQLPWFKTAFVSSDNGVSPTFVQSMRIILLWVFSIPLRFFCYFSRGKCINKICLESRGTGLVEKYFMISSSYAQTKIHNISLNVVLKLKNVGKVP